MPLVGLWRVLRGSTNYDNHRNPSYLLNPVMITGCHLIPITLMQGAGSMLDGKGCWPISSRIDTVMEAQMGITLQDGRITCLADGHVSSIEAIKVKQWIDKRINFAKPGENTE